ncbi:BCD family MFS transporter [Rhizobacter sp. AJA081-3]|uniref:BCD family MFS transporter n=1 Tax=Rhizobacter sp. AJA081-3 TaxID=2753607 RepID=UPI001ADF1B46|nr:BCD family MFS transporter [Rhizobacter sp. AJA081-3]QTN24678.1 BCD family MFS transporter [Rhizobacter sp. AJA081-3]
MTPLGWFGIVRLGLVQMALGAIVVLTTSTLNRVMVVELALPALVPGLLVAIHYAVQITRPRMGFGSDRSGRCTPWILGGMAVLAAGGTLAAAATAWMATERYAGLALAVLAFFFVGLGVSACGTSVLVLLAKSVAAQRRAPAATIVWMMMIIGFAVTAGLAGRWLDPYSPQRLVAVSGGVALIACLVAVAALWRLEGQGGVADGAAQDAEPKLRFLEALRQVWQEAAARRFTIFVFVSMLAFSAQDLILEPFAGAVFGLSPGATTQLSGLQHGGVLLGMIACALAGSRWGIGSLRSWTIGGCIASAFALAGLVAAGVVGPRWPLHATVFALGAANGAFSIAAIGSMMRLAGEGRASREGVRMGLWGASQAISFGVGGLAGAVASDIARRFIDSPGAAYAVVFGAEAVLFLWAAALAAGIETRAPQRRTRRWAWTRSTPTMPS